MTANPISIGLDSTLAAIVDVSADLRLAFFSARPDLLRTEIVDRLTEEAAGVARSDPARAERLVETAVWMADQLNEDHSRARAARAAGHVAQIRGGYGESLNHYARAVSLFEQIGDPLETAITHVGAIHPLGYAGRYDEAYARADIARDVFSKRGDKLRLARLETNVGNILYRQDRVDEALAHYYAALDCFERAGSPQDRAVTVRNLAVCCISLNDFEQALSHYRRAGELCRAHQLTRLVLENDYNIAYLYYLRGEYTRAIELYNVTRLECRRLGDPYHEALCDLDQAELYLELNLTDEGEKLAGEAFDNFERIGMRYEGAKALAFLAIAASQSGRAVRALQLFDHARERLVAEANAIWPSLIDLYKAVVLFDESRNVEAGRAAEAARRTFDTPALATKAALADLLIARLRLRDGDIAAAEQACADALRRLESVDSPGLVFQAQVVLGQICESAGENARAMAAYVRAHQVLERLRSHLAGDELKIAFLKDKLIVFESLVHLLLNGTSGEPDLKKAFKYIEQAKSRSLADLISFRAHALPAPNHGRSNLVDDVRRVREELNWYYHQIDLGQYSPGARSPEHLHALRSKAHDYECHLVELLNELRGTSDEFRSLQQGASGDLETIQASVPDGAMIVEFYEARGVIYAMLVGRRQFEIIPVTSAGRVRGLQRFLNFQLSKFRLGAGYVHRFERELHEATERHLRDLYSELIAPLRDRLAASHLIIVPHDSLHYLPFHALHDGERYLCDSYSISYAPSASVYQLCAAKAVRYEHTSLVLGVPDQAAPFIDDEVRAVAKALPGCRLYVGDDVCEERLRETGRLSRFIHIAAHAYFRQDNPMFSSIRLGQSELTLFDLYRLDLAAELVVLSGCGTGRNVMAGGDEMLGLTRGLLYAGAHSLVLTLWEVCDRSTADFMKLFYAELASEAPNKAEALQRTMRRVREEYPHPYFWAPFVMVGDFQNRSASARWRDEPLTHALSIT